MLGPLLFKIYINDLFFTVVCNYADDTTLHTCSNDISNLIHGLEHDSLLATEWFNSNYMKLNETKCHFLLSMVPGGITFCALQGPFHFLLYSNVFAFCSFF